MIRYPKVFRAKDGRAVVVRLAGPGDIDPLLAFFNNLPEKDRMHLRVDVTQREIMKRRLQPQFHWTTVRLVGVFGDQIVAEATIARRNYGFDSHIGEIRILIAENLRSTGLAGYLSRQLIAHSIVMDLQKVEAHMMEDNIHAVRLAERIGLEREGVLKDFVKDIKGNHHDLLIMSLST